MRERLPQVNVWRGNSSKRWIRWKRQGGRAARRVIAQIQRAGHEAVDEAGLAAEEDALGLKHQRPRIDDAAASAFHSDLLMGQIDGGRGTSEEIGETPGLLAGSCKSPRPLPWTNPPSST